MPAEGFICRVNPFSLSKTIYPMKTIICALLTVATLTSFDLPTVSVVADIPAATPKTDRNAIGWPCSDAGDLSDEMLLPAFSWTETVFDFGKIKHNNPVTHEFRFVNKGADPLIITSVQASCGCTVTKYSKDAIAPGSEGFVTATYNAATKGVFNKTVTVNANTTDGVVVLSIRGEVQ